MLNASHVLNHAINVLKHANNVLNHVSNVLNNANNMGEISKGPRARIRTRDALPTRLIHASNMLSMC